MSAFAAFPTIPYEGPGSKNPLAFKYYNKSQVVLGKRMADWLKFGVCFWHTFRAVGSDPFGAATMIRPWSTVDILDDQILTKCKERVDAAFELFMKLGFHDRDVAPELNTIDETNDLLEKVTDYMLEKQKQTGIKLLWGTANLFSHPRYANGAATNPDIHVFAYAASQVKKAMEYLGSGYVFWGGREGYQSLLNTDLKKELDQLASFFHMAVKYKQKIGANFQFFIEPKPKEPTKHQYDYDAQTVMGFLLFYKLDDHFLLNIEPNHTTLAGHSYEHDIAIAVAYGKLGSVDCNTGDELLGWDTDQFLMDEKKATLVMKEIIKMGGFTSGGLNFDCKVRRESTELEDILIAHIGSMDVFAKGLLNAAWAVEHGRLDHLKSERYSSWKDKLGIKVSSNESAFEELEAFAKSNIVTPKSGKQEMFESIFNQELHQIP
ncbi:hypothetical protein HDV02_006697 [Globomyces sp. JEL0801]|nr:hypothetical protein HDV02_006697 [Globomyces sp. JEL0801]